MAWVVVGPSYLGGRCLMRYSIPVLYCVESSLPFSHPSPKSTIPDLYDIHAILYPP